jgi:hypothetical protein
MGELPNVFLLSSGEESHPNSPRIYFSFDATIYLEIQLQQFCRRPKIITPKPSTVCGQVNDR